MSARNMIDAIVTTTIWKNCYEPKQLTGKTLAGKQKKMIEIDDVVVDESCGKRRGKKEVVKMHFSWKIAAELLGSNQFRIGIHKCIRNT